MYLTITGDHILEGTARLSFAAHKVSEWALGASLRLNATKTKSMFFGSEYRVKALKGLNFPGVDLGDGALVPFVDEALSLGVILDRSLTWKPHVNQVTKKINIAMFGLWFIQFCTTETLHKRLVETLVLSHLDYCTVVYLDASQGLRQRLQRLSNTCGRYIFGLRRDACITPYRIW